jgi:hypothetical protein
MAPPALAISSGGGAAAFFALVLGLGASAGPSSTSDFAAFAALGRGIALRPSALSAFSQLCSATEMLPRARPNWRSMAEYDEGMKPYCHGVTVRAGMSQRGSSGWPSLVVPHSGTSEAAWAAPQMYIASLGAMPFATRWSFMRVHMKRSRRRSPSTCSARLPKRRMSAPTSTIT